MLFIFSTAELIRNLWQPKTVVFLHWCLKCAVPLSYQPEQKQPKLQQPQPEWDKDMQHNRTQHNGLSSAAQHNDTQHKH